MKNKIIAGLLAFFLGGWGIHKFYLNETRPGVIYAVCTFVGWLTSWLIIGLIPVFVVWILAFIDGIKLFIMDDSEFDEKYNKKKDNTLID